MYCFYYFFLFFMFFVIIITVQICKFNITVFTEILLLYYPLWCPGLQRLQRFDLLWWKGKPILLQNYARLISIFKVTLEKIPLSYSWINRVINKVKTHVVDVIVPYFRYYSNLKQVSCSCKLQSTKTQTVGCPVHLRHSFYKAYIFAPHLARS